MTVDNTEKIREHIMALIDAEYDSDASFEREVGLRAKTVNNWRRGRSSSFMKMLPELSERFGVNIGTLLDIPIKGKSTELSEDELSLLHLYRKTRVLPQRMRSALKDTLETTINLYIVSASEPKTARKRGGK